METFRKIREIESDFHSFFYGELIGLQRLNRHGPIVGMDEIHPIIIRIS